MNILIKFPSRGRPEKFKSTLLNHLRHLSGKHKIKFVFSFDEDDATMNNDDIRQFLKNLKIDYKVYYGKSKNKIEAINADMNHKRFDILILIADDMIPSMENYDDAICNIFQNAEHGLDSTIHFNTSMWADILDIWCIMGKKYYDRFKYIYNPEYKTINCDNEYTEVATMLNRRIFSEIMPFQHHHQTGDDTEARNWYFNNEDGVTYHRRKEKNFYINLKK